MPTSPIYAMSADPRAELAHSFAGKRVTVVESPFRSASSAANKRHTGTCLGVGVSNNGTAAHQLILNVGPRFYLKCLSLATVFSIEVA